MYHTFEVPQSCLTLWEQCRSLVPEIIENCTVKTHDLKIVRSNPVDPKFKSIYLIKSGMISETYQGQIIINYESGDLIGIDGLTQEKLTTFENDFAVTVDEYDSETFMEEIFSNKEKILLLNKYLSCLSQSFQILMTHFNQKEVEFMPEFRHYDKGDVIIEENTKGEEVFTLMTGTTKVIVNNTEVGEINKNEIFGAIAALTNTPRTASIVATSDCETIVVKSDNFRGLLAARPDTIQQLVNDMARTIISCNERIMTLSEIKN